ncbi:MAG: hypothetical protein JKY52_20930 [Flavobacteriales bacterium]|nr:hypothetical protein [Flavobacteriales bacterium]
MDITVVANTDVDKVWSRIEGYAEGCAKYTYGRFTANDIRTGIRKGVQTLWVAHEGERILGFVVTELQDYPQLRALVMHFTGGVRLNKWKSSMLAKIQEHAKMNGADRIESYGREGWAKVFEKDGFKSLHNFYELPVGN